MKRLPLALIVASFAGALPAQSSHPSAAKPTIVLVHGAFADGSSWQRVIPILQRDGYSVIAVHRTTKPSIPTSSGSTPNG